jgi:hypothetical protein
LRELVTRALLAGRRRCKLPPPQCASISDSSKLPCQILARYQSLLHLAEAGPGAEGKDRQKRMCLMSHARPMSAKSVSTVYDMFCQ